MGALSRGYEYCTLKGEVELTRWRGDDGVRSTYDTLLVVPEEGALPQGTLPWMVGPFILDKG